MKLRAGEWVEVRRKEDILRTLDKKGQLEGLPFMPQMFQYCGRRFRLYKRAHKTCDTVNQTGGRRLSNCVHLEHRCDGEAYGGCQAACLIFWKEAWLKPVNETGKHSQQALGDEPRRNDQSVNAAHCSEPDVWAGTRSEDHTGDEPRYICQATQLPYFTTLLPWWDIRQYLEDYTSGNVTLPQMFRGFVYAGYINLVWSRIGRRLGLRRVLPLLYDRFQALRGGIPYPIRTGAIPAGQPTPTSALNLQPGELVRVKSYQEILTTLDTESKNRGLLFDKELVPFCGSIYRVRARIDKFIDEKTGTMSTMKTPAIMMEDVWCQARYSSCRLYCPRSIYSWWREVWLERVSESSTSE
jgi:hypothetical protein